jgi:hypothetical protein
MSATELAACNQHRKNYFCRWQMFSTETDTCPITLLRGEKPVVAKLCRKYVSKVPLVAATLHEKDMHRTLITVAKPTAVHCLCPHGSSQPVQWVYNATELVVPAALICKLAVQLPICLMHLPRWWWLAKETTGRQKSSSVKSCPR